MLFGAVALLLFGGRNQISDLMGDVAKGVKSFKKGLAEDDEVETRPVTVARDNRESRRRRGRRRSQGQLNALNGNVRPRGLAEWRRFDAVGPGPVSHVRS